MQFVQAKTNAPMSFMQAANDYFGKLPGQNALQFAGEVKKLTDQDRAEIEAGLVKNGYTITKT